MPTICIVVFPFTVIYCAFFVRSLTVISDTMHRNNSRDLADIWHIAWTVFHAPFAFSLWLQVISRKNSFGCWPWQKKIKPILKKGSKLNLDFECPIWNSNIKRNLVCIALWKRFPFPATDDDGTTSVANAGKPLFSVKYSMNILLFSY